MITNLSRYKNLFFVGDVHGQFDALMFGVKELGITSDECLISVGDLVDRGKQSVECVQFFLTSDNTRMVLGNHEDMFMKRFLDNDLHMKNVHLWNGGEWCDKYPEWYMKDLATKLEDIPRYLTIEHNDKMFGVCHAECPTAMWVDVEFPPSDSVREDVIWGRNKVLDPSFEDQFIKGVDWSIHGHTPCDSVKQVGNQVFIDTGGGIVSATRGLTFLQWDGENFFTHTVNYDSFERRFVLNSKEGVQ